MKKVRVNIKYGEWFWEKENPNHDLVFPIYHFWNNDGEYYTVVLYHQILECIKEPTKEAREKYIKIYG